MTLLFVVEDCFRIGTSGWVLAPGVSSDPGTPEVRIGSRFRLQAPDGTHIDTHVKGLEMIKRFHRPVQITIPIMLPKDVAKEQIPVGTLVYLLAGNGGGAAQPGIQPDGPASGGSAG